MKKILLGVVVGFVIAVACFAAGVAVSAQQKSSLRLDDSIKLGSGTRILEKVCDTSLGTVIYVGSALSSGGRDYSGSSSGIGVTAVPNGCGKIPQ